MKPVESLFNAAITSTIFRLEGKEINLNKVLQNLCYEIKTEEGEIDWNMVEGAECCLADLIIGGFWAYTEYHEGQYSDSYKTLCELGSVFQPNMSSPPSEEEPEHTAYSLICEHLSKGA